MKSYIVRTALFPLYHRLTRSGVMECISDLRENQWLSAEELEIKQKREVARLLQHAYASIPEYNRRFSEVGIGPVDLKDEGILGRLPLLTKEDINQNRTGMLMSPDRKDRGRVLPNSTSGSTGEAIRFWIDMRAWAYRRAEIVRNQEWLGIKLGDRQSTLWGAQMDLSKVDDVRGRVHGWINNYTMMSSYELDEKALRSNVEKLRKFRPLLLTSYPGPLTVLAEYMLSEGLTVDGIRGIISSAETLHEWQKATIEKAFGCPVFNRYGCREFGSVGHECSHREGLHVSVDRLVVEVLDQHLQPCQPGETGELVITDLYNHAMPFIRYRIGDRATVTNEVCSCGRGLPVLKRIDGRTLDVVRTRNGNAIGGTFWTLLFRSAPGFSSFQVVQDSIDGIIVNYVKDRSVADAPISRFRREIADKCGGDFTVTFREVDSIPKTDSGKTRFVISRLDGRL